MSFERMTRQQLQILEFLDETDWVFGREIMKGTGMPSGTVYPALSRLTIKGLIEAEREVGDPRILQRPLRIHYRLTARGASVLPNRPRRVSAPVTRSGGD